MRSIIFHIDVNSAFLSWSALKRLEEGDSVDIRKLPSIVGGDIQKRHGVVLAKSIPAKKYGITTGEPIVNALRKCPSLLIEKPDMSLYHKKSRELMHFLSGICPEIEQLSIDECFMDFTPVSSNFPSPEAAAENIKNEIRERFGFTVNIGISDKKVLAKMASDFRKPDLVHTLYTHEIPKKMWSLPVSSLYMCGHAATQTLQKLEIRTIGDLARADKDIIASHLKSHGILLWEYANGIDASAVLSAPAQAKGIGNSITLPKDAMSRRDALPYLLSLSDNVAQRLRNAGQLAGMISVEIKYSDFKTASHQTVLPAPSSTSKIIYSAACQLFDDLWNGSPIRLLGVRSARLTDAADPVQLSLFDPALFSKAEADAGSLKKQTSPSLEKLDTLDKTIDAIRQKYGKDAIVRGSLLPDSPSRKRPDKTT